MFPHCFLTLTVSYTYKHCSGFVPLQISGERKHSSKIRGCLRWCSLLVPWEGQPFRGRGPQPDPPKGTKLLPSALVTFEVGDVLCLLFLLLASPLARLLYYFVSESVGTQVLIFATSAGTRVSNIESVARAVLPKFYLGDIHPESWRVFSGCGRRCILILTANPRIMVEASLKDYLRADLVLGTDIVVYIKGRHTDEPFMALCKEGFMVPPATPDKLPKPIVFPDGRDSSRSRPHCLHCSPSSGCRSASSSLALGSRRDPFSPCPSCTMPSGHLAFVFTSRASPPPPKKSTGSNNCNIRHLTSQTPSAP
ncbi:hypothetical protein MLD38_017039 [Melastoma candidum]|uniref:Uncharacterized protein n=1 Tax=Melastoma candidum TaxID=119954 RepID=A0ACB9QPE7_9MYRT|nr:hypothetical protein MLD38_017039 [Melastoma candidum]